MNRFERELERRQHTWVELSDDEYEARFVRLSAFWHPAIAAVMAHQSTAGIPQRWT